MSVKPLTRLTREFRTFEQSNISVKKKKNRIFGQVEPIEQKIEKNNLVTMSFYCNVAVERDVLLVSVQIAEMGARSCGPLRSACPRSSIFPLCSVLPRSCTTF